jgi:hypothetical protein
MGRSRITLNARASFSALVPAGDSAIAPVLQLRGRGRPNRFQIADRMVLLIDGSRSRGTPSLITAALNSERRDLRAQAGHAN